VRIYIKLNKPNSLVDELQFLDEPTCEIQKVPHLAAILGMTDIPNIISPLLSRTKDKPVHGLEGHLPVNILRYYG